jgi:hypothetical protein
MHARAGEMLCAKKHYLFLYETREGALEYLSQARNSDYNSGHAPWNWAAAAYDDANFSYVFKMAEVFSATGPCKIRAVDKGCSFMLLQDLWFGVTQNGYVLNVLLGERSGWIIFHDDLDLRLALVSV